MSKLIIKNSIDNTLKLSNIGNQYLILKEPVLPNTTMLEDDFFPYSVFVNTTEYVVDSNLVLYIEYDIGDVITIEEISSATPTINVNGVKNYLSSPYQYTINEEIESIIIEQEYL